MACITRSELTLLIGIAVWLCGVVPSSGNQMDPHVYPAEGPYFEGWYLRVIDRPQNSSFGFLFGLVLPASGANLTSKLGYKWESSTATSDYPLLCSSLLLSPAQSSKLQSPTACFDPQDYSVLKDGKPVTQNPDDETPPNFTAQLGENISFVVTPTGVQFSLGIDVHRLEGETTAPVPWGPHGEGPESWLEHLPLPIHWFIYSLRSTVVWYSYINSYTGQVIKGGTNTGALGHGSPQRAATPVIAHMEKNWGGTFPEAWVWAEGADPNTNVSFSFSSGLLRELFLDIPAQLSGYRNPDKGISCSFNPVDSVHTLTQDGCAGHASLLLESLECRVLFNLSAEPSSFSECLVTPQKYGFVPGCVESYQARAEITVVLTTLTREVKDHQVIQMAGLEFGGSFVCDSHCPDAA